MNIDVTVSVMIEKDGKFLLLERSPSSTITGLWEFPAGKLEPGESVEEAAKRETKEETGLNVNGLHYRGYSERFGSDRQAVIHHFKASVEGELQLNDKEHSAFMWVTKEQLLSLPRLDHIPPKQERDEGNFSGKISIDAVRHFSF